MNQSRRESVSTSNAAINTPGSEIYPGLNQVFYESLRPVSLGVGIIYVIITVWRLLFLSDQLKPLRTPLAGASLLTAMILLIMWALLRSQIVPLVWANPLGAVIVSLALANSLIHLHLTGKLQETTNVMLVLLGMGCFFLSLPWLIGMLLASLAAWFGAVWGIPASGSLSHYSFSILLSMLGSFLLYQMRLTSLGRLEGNVAKRTNELSQTNVLLKEQMAELQQAQDKNSELINSIDGIVWEADAETFQFTYISKQAERLLGYPVESWLTQPTFWVDHVHPDDRDWASDFCMQAVKEKRAHDFEYRMLAADGRTVWLRDIVNVVLDGDRPAKLRGVMVDTGQRRRAELEQAVITEIVQGANLAHVDVSLEDLLGLIHRSLGKVLYAENCFVALRDTDSELFHFPFFVDSHNSAPEPSRLAKSSAAYVYRTGRPLLLTMELRHKLVESGEIAPTGTDARSWLGVPLITQEGIIGILVVQHYDNEHVYTEQDSDFLASVAGHVALAIERKRVEEKLRESEERYRLFFEQDLTGVYVSTPGGQLLDCNQAFVRIFGFDSREQALARTAVEYHLTSEDRMAFIELVQQKKSVEYLEMTARRRDGTLVHVVENVTGTFNGRGQLIQIRGHVMDITEQKHLEEQLRQSQKMEAVGRLAGGVAHDFNNMLTAILGHSELLLIGMERDNPRRSSLEEIKRAAERSASLTQQLLAFSRKQILQPRVFELNALIVNLERMLQRLIGEDVNLATDLFPGLGQINADPSQLEQVIMNLAVNARDAMPRGGNLLIKTANVDLDELYGPGEVAVAPGSYVLLSVCDTGIGMTAETRAQIFEPFFTTKEVGVGTGLGLSTVYGIVKQSGGYIFVDSEPGHGSNFKVYLPRYDKQVEPSDSTTLNLKIPKGEETVLVVEDEDVVRSLIQHMLEMNGYKVMEAGNGQEALEICNQNPGMISLVLTDVVMPKMGGRELAEVLAEFWPQIKVIFMSGYTDDAIVRHGVKAEAVPFLQKPFLPGELARKVREVLEAGS